MDLSLDQTELWRREYNNKGIPSSFREEPSGSLRDFLGFLARKGRAAGRALDIGAGTGRNSLVLADHSYEVVSLELVPELVDRLQRASVGRRSPNRITALRHDITTPWPLEDKSVDIATDMFCYKHQITEEGKRTYRDELARVLKPLGHYLLTLAGLDDGYYAALLPNSPDPQRHVIVDPHNGIPSILYTREEIEKEFASRFTLVRYVHKRRNSLMHGDSYNRSTHLFIFQRRPDRFKGT
jgi:SAM-dependent methyltransferase